MNGKYEFEWDPEKEIINVIKHGINFVTASKVFADPKRKIIIDSKHSGTEDRLFCLGNIDGKILTVRFTYRGSNIRIIGAGFWRGGKINYEE